MNTISNNKPFTNAATLYCFTPVDVTETQAYDDFCFEREVHNTLVKQIERQQQSIVTEADDLVSLFDRCLAEVTG